MQSQQITELIYLNVVTRDGDDTIFHPADNVKQASRLLMTGGTPISRCS